MTGLKPLMTRLRVGQRELARALGWSPAAVNVLVNRGQWPARVDRVAAEHDIRALLAARGASDGELMRAFETTTPPCSNTAASIAGKAGAQQESVMLLRRQSLFPATRKHFGIFRDPFSDDVQSHEDVFASPDVRYVREAMFQTARNGGFLAVVGESGAGKSTLRRDLIDRIGREQHPIIVIEPYVLGMEDNDSTGKTLKAGHIAESILAAVAPLEKPKRSPEARFAQLHRVLRDSRRGGNHHVLVIEEAHALPIPTLKHLKRFIELEDGFRGLLSIVLLGQSELRLKLAEGNHAVREVVQRCEVVELLPLDARLEDYLKFKLARVGKTLADVIDAGGIDALREKLTVNTGRREAGKPVRDTVSLLYPLAVNNLLTGALNLAADLGAPKVTADVVRSV